MSAPLLHGMRVFERGWLSSNNILFLGDRGTALVDSGYATHSQQTLALVRDALQGRNLDVLVNTHLHSDHCGGNADLQTGFPELRTWVPATQAGAVSRWDTVALSYATTGQSCERFSFTDMLRPGSELQLGDHLWQVHAAPGHDPHSLVLFEPCSRTLLSADALWESGFGVVFPELEGEHAFDAVAATLDLIEALQPAVVVPGHGSVFSDVGLALGRARSRLAAYLAQPERHASHGAKVLLKFKLLELQSVPRAELLQWALATRYFGMVRARWFSSMSAEAWFDALVSDLERSGVALREGEYIANR
ncbi:MBL fold metallo-hydrolase [Ramlibacter sp. G-1-2-2]|uniref:MBL fold metallo-hydrolase n=1 Tax=Ramlibacter agri TaxID=2728837 RepID=A0A848H814_9BURK|nr:MBL fold metallo-hydrolase [Ramlibacter agri]NML46935.1 MBL fold metallo-hydrolase [Ramlibacter agri]